MSTQSVLNRRYEFDWLRVSATLIVFFYHSTRFFNQRDWMVKNADTYAWVDIWCIFALNWLMPLFFMISGVSLFYSVERSGGRQKFFADKFLRLMVPVIAASVTHSALQVYLERVTHGLFCGSFFAFIPHYFDGVYQGIGKQGGNFCFVGMHLWYLLFLFIDSLILYRLFIRLKGRGNLFLNRITTMVAAPGLIYIWFALPLIIMYAAIPTPILTIGAGDWGFFYYLWFLTAGFMVVSSKRLQQCIRSQRWISLFLGVILSALFLYRSFDSSIMVPPVVSCRWPDIAVYFLSAWSWLFAILGFGMHRLTFGHAFLRQANEGVLPFYILHQSVLVGVGYFIIGWEIHDFLKWGLIFSTTFIIIVTLYAFFIRKYEPLRFLFGLKTAQPFYRRFRKRGALTAGTAVYIGLILFAASGISVDRTPMELTYDSSRDVILTPQSVTKQSLTGVSLVADDQACSGSAIEFSSGANQEATSPPEAFVEMQFTAPAGRYFIWLRGRSRTEWADSVWLQMDDHIDTSIGNLRMGNWLSIHPPDRYAWAGDGDRPIAVELKHSGTHKIRLHPRQTPHRIDQIWLSRFQPRIPNTSRPIER